VAVDVKRRDKNDASKGWDVYTHGGRINTNKDAIQWIKEAEMRGAGEILLTSMDCDGTKSGFDIPLYKLVSETVKIPVIASGGAGDISHMIEVLENGKADAVLAASIFHFNELTVYDIKKSLKEKGVNIRL
ncbi:MAG: hypothetical protein ACD_79C00770G0001, partial [uncultured bacterium]